MYATLDEAEVYFQDRLFAEVWTETDSENKTKSLKRATQLIDRLNFAGSKAVTTQELEFPRGTDTTIPQAIKDACCEIAINLLDGRDPEYDDEMLNVEQVSFGMGRERRNVSLIPEATAHGIPSNLAWKLLKPYLIDGTELVLSRIS